MKIIKKYNNSFIIFLIIAIIYAVGNFIWWQINTPVIFITEFSSLHFYDIFRKGWLFYNAPLITWIMRGAFYIFGKEYYDLIIIFVNYIFFLIPLYFVYKIGAELKDKETGNIAMILFSLVPAVYGMSRQYGEHDYHIMAPMTFGIYCLIKTDYFSNRKWSVWYGISIGLGLMIRDVFIVYFFAPYIYIAIVSLKDRICKTQIINIFMSICAASLIAGWHYFRYEIIIKKVMFDAFRSNVSLLTFDVFRVTTIGLCEELLSPPVFLLFIISLIFFIFKYKNKYKNVILLWLIYPWCILTFMPHLKLSEYELGFVPAIVLMCAILLAHIKISHIKKSLLILFFVVISFLQYISFSFYKLELFNKKIKYRNHVIKYFNTDIYYNNNAKNLIMAEYLKSKYFNNKFCIVAINSHFHDIAVQLWLNDMYARFVRLIDYKVFQFDIIIFLNRVYTAEEVFNFETYNRLNDPIDKNIYTDQIKSITYKNIQNVFKKLNKKYHIIDIFYLNESKEEDSKVILFGRKDKFPPFVQ